MEGSENTPVVEVVKQEETVVASVDAQNDISKKTANQKGNPNQQKGNPNQQGAPKSDQPKKQKGENTNTGSRGRQKKGMIELEPTIGCRYDCRYFHCFLCINSPQRFLS